MAHAPVDGDASKPGRTPGYPEPQPRDREDARKRGRKPPPEPDEGGLGRDPEQDGTHDGD